MQAGGLAVAVQFDSDAPVHQICLSESQGLVRTTTGALYSFVRLADEVSPAWRCLTTPVMLCTWSVAITQVLNSLWYEKSARKNCGLGIPKLV